MAAIELFRWDPATIYKGPEANDRFVVEDAWNDVMYQLGQEVQDREMKTEYSEGRYNPIWHNQWFAEGTDLGWRKQSGRKVFKTEAAIGAGEFAKKGESFIQGLIPKTANMFIVYRYDIEQPNTGLLVVNYHHDSPQGDRYVVMPLAWMFQEGYWWGIEEGGDTMIPEIREAVFDAWEEYLMRSDGLFPDFGFDVVFSNFLEEHQLKIRNIKRKEDLEEFKRMFSHYSFKFLNDWETSLQSWMKEDFKHDGAISSLGDYIESYLENLETVIFADMIPGNVKKEMERIYKEVEKAL